MSLGFNDCATPPWTWWTPWLLCGARDWTEPELWLISALEPTAFVLIAGFLGKSWQQLPAAADAAAPPEAAPPVELLLCLKRPTEGWVDIPCWLGLDMMVQKIWILIPPVSGWVGIHRLVCMQWIIAIALMVASAWALEAWYSMPSKSPDNGTKICITPVAAAVITVTQMDVEDFTRIAIPHHNQLQPWPTYPCNFISTCAAN